MGGVVVCRDVESDHPAEAEAIDAAAFGIGVGLRAQEGEGGERTSPRATPHLAAYV